MGALCFHSPKYHCELACEGIEYSWGNAIYMYRIIKAANKRRKHDFQLCVEKSLCRETSLSIDRVRKNSRRAREYIEYMVAYLILSIESDGENRTSFELRELKPCAVSSSKIEQMKQNVRTHRSAVDFDAAFCKVSIKHESIERASSKGTIV